MAAFKVAYVHYFSYILVHGDAGEQSIFLCVREMHGGVHGCFYGKVEVVQPLICPALVILTHSVYLDWFFG